MDLLNNDIHENWYSTNIDETTVLCIESNTSYRNRNELGGSPGVKKKINLTV